LEKYFLSSFHQDSDTDESGSVGSDSEGRPSPEQRRKRLFKARGTARHSSDRDDGSEVFEVCDDSTETDSCENGGKRAKKKKQRPLVIHHDDHAAGSADLDDPEDGAKTPQPELPPEPPQPTRKHHSRDSGFIGSCDDLLKTGPSGSSSSSNEEQPAEMKTPTASPVPTPILPEFPAVVAAGPPRANNSLARKDSFNNWSSDEETNLMMSKMRALFKTMVNGGKGSQPVVTTPAAAVPAVGEPKSDTPRKPPQLVYFESELTRLMKTVPGIKDEQVKEIVEYLSSEDTWSDSYDSSDYTSSDLEGPRSELQQQISASCQEIIQVFDPAHDETVEPTGDGLVYQRLVKSLSRMSESPNHNNSPPLMAKVMHHIGSRLVALMHEVSAASDLVESPPSPKPRFRKLHRQQLSPASSSLDESDSPGGSDTESRVRRHPSLPRSKSHDLGQWEHLLQERGVPRESLRSSSSGVSDLEREDYERFSWRGSFESALAADSRSKLSFEAKRRSTGSGSASDLFSSSDQLDNRGRVRSCGSIGSRASLPGRGGARLSSSGGDLLTAAESELLDARRRGSVPDSVSPRSTTLPRSNPAASASTNSLPRLPLSASPVVAAIHKSYSAQLHAQQHSPLHHTHHHHFLQNVKSARYRPPNFRPPPLGPPKRAVSAPGLHHATRRTERRTRPLSGGEYHTCYVYFNLRIC
jgi:synaptotagmin-like protein